ncbi:MAG: hypothetical protein H0U91_12285 [Rubrobacter sp.]|jgi:hypothetical protein|nr:hypothetical protein [Rubrobacter sp.]MBA3951243.1 hypothetical protein [Rubrobacter sp.]MDQ3361527.1 DUF4926 domain-containing protein [Actinomycetota bacterium]MDQ3377006.1 DUF4926 domain-containing protein [Actinomycetota bacterium]
MRRTPQKTYREFDPVEIPDAVPELGVQSGDRGVIEHIYDGGRMLSVEVPKPGGVSAGFVDIDVSGAEPRVVAYSKLSA